MPARYLELDLWRFIDIEHRSRDKSGNTTGYYIDDMQGVSEETFDWFMDYGYDYTPEVDDDDIEEAYKLITKDLPVSSTWLHEHYEEDIKSEIERAKRDAIRNDYESGWLNAFREQLVDNIITSIEEAGLSTDKVYTYKSGDFKHKTLLKRGEIGWEHNSIAIKLTRQEMLDALGYESNYEPIGYGGVNEFITWDMLADEMIEAIDIKPVNREHIDYYGNRWGDDKDWPEYFSDYSETWGAIRDNLKSQQSQLKAYIKNNVPINYRFI